MPKAIRKVDKAQASLHGEDTGRIVEVYTQNGRFLVADTSTVTMSDLAGEFLLFDQCVCDGSFSGEVCRPASGERVSIRTSAIESVVFLADNAEGSMNSGVRFRRHLLLHDSEGTNGDSGD